MAATVKAAASIGSDTPALIDSRARGVASHNDRPSTIPSGLENDSNGTDLTFCVGYSVKYEPEIAELDTVVKWLCGLDNGKGEVVH